MLSREGHPHGRPPVGGSIERGNVRPSAKGRSTAESRPGVCPHHSARGAASRPRPSDPRPPAGSCSRQYGGPGCRSWLRDSAAAGESARADADVPTNPCHPDPVPHSRGCGPEPLLLRRAWPKELRTRPVVPARMRASALRIRARTRADPSPCPPPARGGGEIGAPALPCCHAAGSATSGASAVSAWISARITRSVTAFR